MLFDVSKDDLIALIKGLTGYESYEFANQLNKEGWGELAGFPNEKWHWNDRAFQVRSEAQLMEFYNRLKEKIGLDRYPKKRPH
jgi:hypothetical protein